MLKKKKKTKGLEDRANNLGVLSSKFRSIRSLIDRNRTKSLPKKIKFPFVVVEPSEEPETEVVIKMQADLTKAVLTSNKIMGLFGDLEVINRMPTLTQTGNDNPDEPSGRTEGKLRI